MNMEPISVTADVLKELKSRLVNELQLENMQVIFVTAEVFKFVKLILVTFTQPENHHAVETGFMASLKDTDLTDLLFLYHGA